jgi:hypothetical protein
LDRQKSFETSSQSHACFSVELQALNAVYRNDVAKILVRRQQSCDDFSGVPSLESFYIWNHFFFEFAEPVDTSKIVFSAFARFLN